MGPDAALARLGRDNDSYKKSLAQVEGKLARRNSSLLNAVSAGATHSQIAEVLGVSRGRVGQVIQAALRSIPREQRLQDWAEMRGGEVRILDHGTEWTTMITLPPNDRRPGAMHISVSGPSREEAIANALESIGANPGMREPR
jgi:transposase InsO family protein